MNKDINIDKKSSGNIFINLFFKNEKNFYSFLLYLFISFKKVM